MNYMRGVSLAIRGSIGGVLLLLLVLLSVKAVLAQESVLSGYQVCSAASGSTICSFQPLDLMHPLPVTLTPPGAGITGNATGTTGAVVGTLAAATGKTTYICGFDVTAVGGTAQVGPIAVAGLVGGSAVYYLASSAAGTVLPVRYTPCIPASAVNTAIIITTTADGTASAVTVNSWGYQQ